MDRITVERVKEAKRLAEVADGVFDGPVRPDRLAAYLASPDHLLVLAFDGGLVVGQCAGVIHHHPDKPDELYVDEVGTADAYLRRGIATRMMAVLVAEARAAGCEECWLGTKADNLPARALYRRWQPAPEPILMYQFGL